MGIKYYTLSFIISLICIIISLIFIAPYGFESHEEEHLFEEALISVISPLKGERKIKLELDNKYYWLSCYGVEKFCDSPDDGAKYTVKNVRVLLITQNETSFLNGVLLSFNKDKIYFSNSKFINAEKSLIFVLASNALFSFKLAGIFGLVFIFLYMKRI